MENRSPRMHTDSNPLPTDSMVTVRLSVHHPEPLPKPNIFPELESLAARRASQISLQSSISSSSSSSHDGMTSPTSSGSVDWEELEKTEEQEPRDEGTDDVSRLKATHLRQHAKLYSPLLFSLLAWNKRIMLWSPILSRGWPRKAIRIRNGELDLHQFSTSRNLSMNQRDLPFDTLSFPHLL